jgi:hypothetical protein
MKSEYDMIPEELEKYLQNYFADYNGLLFYYIDEDFKDRW